jgi:glycosyltransferase involved in cell wall biosynthesis
MLSSISEGFPFSIIEAMSCGRTTVSTDVGGVSEAVGDTGLVVPPREPEKLAAAALTLLKDDERRLKLGELARQRVIDRFTLRRSVDNFRTIYQELAGMPEVYEPTLETVADWTLELRDPWYAAVATDGTGW